MTTERPELVIEGSDDGKTWKPYEFVWKPGDPMREPTFTRAPHAAARLADVVWRVGHLLRPHHARLAADTLRQLREGNPNVLGLLENNPFPAAPPKLIRIVVYLYKFTTPEERAKTGAWWTRTQLAVLNYT